MESWNRMTALRGEEEGGGCLKLGEGISHRTYMNVPWTWTTVWGLIMEVGGEGERIGTTVIAKTIKHFLKVWRNNFKK